MNRLGLQRVLEYGTENRLRVNLSPESVNFEQISELVSKYKDAIDVTLFRGNHDVLTDIDILFASTSLENLDELMKEVYKQWIEKRFKELSKGKFIWINQSTFDSIIDFITANGSIPIKKSEKVQFCEEQNDTSSLLLSAMQTMSPVEILSLIEGSMIVNNFRNYSSAGSRSFDSGIRFNTGNGLENLTEVSEAIAEDEDETEKIQNLDDLKTHLSQCFFGKYALVSTVNKGTAIFLSLLEYYFPLLKM